MQVYTVTLLCMQSVSMTSRTAGEVFSVSLAQSGPARASSQIVLTRFLQQGDFDAMQLTKEDVDDLEYALLIERMHKCCKNLQKKKK